MVGSDWVIHFPVLKISFDVSFHGDEDCEYCDDYVLSTWLGSGSNEYDGYMAGQLWNPGEAYMHMDLVCIRRNQELICTWKMHFLVCVCFGLGFTH